MHADGRLNTSLLHVLPDCVEPEIKTTSAETSVTPPSITREPSLFDLKDIYVTSLSSVTPLNWSLGTNANLEQMTKHDTSEQVTQVDKLPSTEKFEKVDISQAFTKTAKHSLTVLDNMTSSVAFSSQNSEDETSQPPKLYTEYSIPITDLPSISMDVYEYPRHDASLQTEIPAINFTINMTTANSITHHLTDGQRLLTSMAVRGTHSSSPLLDTDKDDKSWEGKSTLPPLFFASTLSNDFMHSCND